MEILKDETGSQGNLLLSKYENQKVFRNFMLSLRSECTRKLYCFIFSNFCHTIKTMSIYPLMKF